MFVELDFVIQIPIESFPSQITFSTLKELLLPWQSIGAGQCLYFELKPFVLLGVWRVGPVLVVQKAFLFGQRLEVTFLDTH